MKNVAIRAPVLDKFALARTKEVDAIARRVQRSLFRLNLREAGLYAGLIFVQLRKAGFHLLRYIYEFWPHTDPRIFKDDL